MIESLEASVWIYLQSEYENYRIVCVFYRFVRNLNNSKEGWLPAANLLTLIGESKSSQSLTSSGEQAASNSNFNYTHTHTDSIKI